MRASVAGLNKTLSPEKLLVHSLLHLWRIGRIQLGGITTMNRKLMQLSHA